MIAKIEVTICLPSIDLEGLADKVERSLSKLGGKGLPYFIKSIDVKAVKNWKSVRSPKIK